MVDYDNDGFLDLFVTNGLDLKPFNNGPSQLFKNLGNDNHWIEIDLIGTVSNRDGIGTLVYVTTDEIVQLREQNGGMHYRSQNFPRLHYGLGENNVIDKIVVYWPSGIISGFTNVQTNQILKIIEPSNSISPRSQSVLGIIPEDVICNTGLDLIFKSSDGIPVCVKQSTKQSLVDRGWAIEGN